MSDTSEGSGTAPSGDQSDDPERGPQRGLIGRLIGALATPEPAARRGLPGLASLKRLSVADVAIPKAEIAAVPVDIGPEDLIGVVRASGFSRLPVYAETLDHPLGLLLLKDLVLRYGFSLGDQALELKSMLRPLLYVPSSMPLLVLLQKMQAERIHMALVIDEYGGVDGLVTIEDLLEQIVGEIDDEHDTEDDALWQAEGEAEAGVWQVQARAEIADFRDGTGIDLTVEDEDIDSLGGLVLVLAGRVPVRGEVIQHPAGYEIEVLDADPRRVKRLRLRPAAAPDAA